jgi:hypothetical protein
MKKIYLFTLFISVLFTACESDLDQNPISEFGAGSYYKNVAEIEQAVNGVYNSLQAYPQRQFNLSDVRSDNIYGVGMMGVRPHEHINNFVTTLATNTTVEEAWNTNYTSIMRANTVLEYISEELISDKNAYNRLLGEAKFLRAFAFFDLVRYFGPVPIIDHPVSQSEALEIGRNTVDDVYDFIISDLKDAITLLPDSYSNSKDLGRATSFAARGILARVYLTRSGPKLHPEGPCLATNEYNEALSLLNEIINSGKYDTLSEYADIFDLDNENNKEIVFDIQYTSGGNGTGASYPGDLAGADYWSSIGFPYPIGLENKDVSYDLIDSYGTDDKRFEFNVLLGYVNVTTGLYVEDPGCVKFSKNDSKTWGISASDFPLNFPVLRYTDVLMMKAECILKGASGGSQADVDQIVNVVRTRAGLESLSNVTLADLMEERRKEFLGEGLRWHDLVRTGMVLDVINAWIPNEDVRDQMLCPIDYKHIIYPIPQNQMDIKQGLYTQNDGYK